MTAETIAYTDRVPNAAVLGTDITSATDASDALRIAGLDWDLIDTPADDLTILSEDGVTLGRMPGRRLISRSDSDVILAAVGSRYATISNYEAFSLSDDAKALGAQFAHAGEIDHGRTTFMTMSIPEASVQIAGVDPIDFGFYLRTSHGAGAATWSVSARRLVCTNGMEVGLPGSSRTFSIRHSASAQHQLTLASKAVQDAMVYAKTFAAHAEKLVDDRMSTREFTNFIDTLCPKPEEGRKAATTRWENRRASLQELFTAADTQEEIRGTRWAAFNAVSEYHEWLAPTRGDSDRARALRQFSGTSDDFRQRAYSLLTA